jgi:hypothetical protein
MPGRVLPGALVAAGQVAVVSRLVLVAAVLAALIAGCDNQGCHPGDVKASGDQRLKCGPDGEWHR